MFFALLLQISASVYSQTPRAIRPSDTDQRIEDFNNNHIVYYNGETGRKDKLFLFLPGTGGVPAVYLAILEVASDLGYHSIGLMYPNQLAINVACALTIDTACHSRARQEIITGQDRHPLYSVDSVNSISNRLFQLLRYLGEQFPSENWSTYVSGDTIHWNKIVVGGHSQGAGHAGYLGTITRIDRAILIAGMDWIPLLMRPADWHNTRGKTPANRYYGFAHELDERVNFERLQQAWKASGMMDFGDWVSVDRTLYPYNQSHLLSTREPPFNDPEKYHGAPVVDIYSPRISPSEFLFVPVWDYLIDFESTTSASQGENMQTEFNVFPNPVSDICHVVCEGCTGPYSLWLCDITGNRRLVKGQINHRFSFRTDQLAPGIYFLQCKTGHDVASVRLTVLR